jgi:hypothetical protein
MSTAALAPPARQAPADQPADRTDAGTPGTGSPADGRRVARLFTVLSLALAPLVVAIAVLLLPAGSADDKPVIQVLPRPTTANPAPAGQATDDPGTLVRP